MKRLLICNTYFQLIISLQLSLTLFQDDKITIIITDKTPNTKLPAQKLEELRVVDKVLYRKTNAYCGKGMFGEIGFRMYMILFLVT